MTDVFKVVTNDGRKLFEGLEKDARTFIEQHFPWVHSQPGSNAEPIADVKMVSPSGDEATFHGAHDGWSDAQTDAPAPVVEPLSRYQTHRT